MTSQNEAKLVSEGCRDELIERLHAATCNLSWAIGCLSAAGAEGSASDLEDAADMIIELRKTLAHAKKQKE